MPTDFASDLKNSRTALAVDLPTAADITLTPTIVAGNPASANPAEADSPDLRIDPNERSSPFAGVVSISVVAPNGGDFLCSGTAISPRHVLTAAHCLDIENEDGLIDVAPKDVTVNFNIQGPSAPPIAIAAAALAVFDNGGDRYRGFSSSISDDLAVLTLSRDLPASVPIYDISRQPLTPQSIITLVGYGTTGNGITGHQSGTATTTIKRVGQNRVDDPALLASFVDEVDEVFTFDFDGPDVATNALFSVGSGLTLGNRVETTVGPGDSGGPSFQQMGDEWVLVGVNTFGYAIPDVEAPSSEVIQGTFGTGGGGVILAHPEKLDWLDSVVGDALNFADWGSITGTVWHDRNGDGDRSPAEPALVGWTTYLDLNQNGRLDSVEPTTLTDTTGTYRFSKLEAGNYTVAGVARSGWQQTTPTVFTAEQLNADFDGPVSGTTDDRPTVTLAAGQDVTAVDFGFQRVKLNAAAEFNPPNNPDLSTAALVGLFDYEQYLRYRGAAIADVPTDTVGVFPLAQLFDENYYLYTNPDVATAVATGSFAAGYDHFVAHGLDEGRNPSLLYSEQYYLANADDVAQAVAQGSFDSGLQHFLQHGHRENRDPSANFDQGDYLIRNVDVAQAVQQGQVHSAFEHYVRFGVDEVGRLPASPAAAVFNEGFYRQAHPEVAGAIAQGQFADGFDHFVRLGQFQNLAPSLQLDLGTYLANNPAAQSAVDAGSFVSAFDYFVQVDRFATVAAG